MICGLCGVGGRDGRQLQTLVGHGFFFMLCYFLLWVFVLHQHVVPLWHGLFHFDILHGNRLLLRDVFGEGLALLGRAPPPETPWDAGVCAHIYEIYFSYVTLISCQLSLSSPGMYSVSTPQLRDL